MAIYPIQTYDCKCQACNHTFKDSVFILSEGNESYGVTECPRCKSVKLIKMKSEVVMPVFSAPSISYTGSKTMRQRVPDSFKDVLKNIRDKAPGGKGMRSSVI